jgi:chromosome segregation ATPase
MINRKLTRSANQVADDNSVGPQNDDQADEFEMIPADLAAAAAQFRQDADDHREQASRARSEAGAVVSAAEQEAARIVTEARQQARELATAGTDDEHQADGLAERARLLESAVTAQDQAEAAERQAGHLAAEREHLVALAAELDGKISGLRTESGRTAGDLAEALDGADIDSISALRSRVDSIKAAEAALSGQLATARQRAAAIGDGSTRSPGDLLRALNIASARRTNARALVNRAYPDSAQARLDHAHGELRAALEGNLERIADEGRQQPRSPQQVVMNRR